MPKRKRVALEDPVEDLFAECRGWHFGKLGLLDRRYARPEVHLFGLPYFGALVDLPEQVYGNEQRDVDVWTGSLDKPHIR